MTTCAACTKEITICDECGGMICTEGCLDRAEDGCICDDAVEDDE